MKRLYIYYEDHRVGVLSRDEELVYGFTYDPKWLENPQRFPLSLAMPLQSAPFGNRITLSFFENLLPEGLVKDSIERRQGISGTFDFLKHYGKDCAGAIIVTEQESLANNQWHDGKVQIDMQQVYTAINEHHTVADVIAEMNPGYLSLAGAQDKFPAIFDGQNFYLPTKGAPTTHIVKVPIQHSGIKESVYNEYYCMELARAIGLPVPRTYLVAGQHPLLVIERYDRYADEKGIIHRIHQQDFCQAHGFTSELKYEDKGGPTLKQNYDLILENMSAREKLSSVQLFLDWIGFNLIIGNHDSHSKNISFLLKTGGYQLAPLYDLICTSIYPKLKTSFSFKIGDRDDFSKIGQNQIALLEKELRLRQGVFATRLTRIVKEVLAKKDIQAQNISALHAEAKIPLRISKLIDDRIKGLQRQGLDFSRSHKQPSKT